MNACRKFNGKVLKSNCDNKVNKQHLSEIITKLHPFEGRTNDKLKIKFSSHKKQMVPKFKNKYFIEYQ